MNHGPTVGDTTVNVLAMAASHCPQTVDYGVENRYHPRITLKELGRPRTNNRPGPLSENCRTSAVGHLKARRAASARVVAARRLTTAWGAMRSKPWNTAGMQCSSVGTPAWRSRSA